MEQEMILPIEDEVILTETEEQELSNGKGDDNE